MFTYHDENIEAESIMLGKVFPVPSLQMVNFVSHEENREYDYALVNGVANNCLMRIPNETIG